MTKKTKIPQLEATVSRETLDDTPPRVLKLLVGIGTSLPVRAALEQRGFGEEDRHEGWALLQAAGEYRPSVNAGLEAAGGARVDTAVRDAVIALDAWDEDGFRIIRATLQRRFPDQARTVLDGLTASIGPAAVLGVATLLQRLDALEKSKAKDDRDALALLAKRGFDAAERKRLRALVATAQSAAAVAEVAPGPGDAAEQTELAERHLAALVALRAWYEEWSAIARSAVKRRDRLILIGLAKRKTSRGATVVAPGAADDGGAAATGA